ncbi:MAG: TIGR02147 family protein [Bacteriovoracaceae bacterium]
MNIYTYTQPEIYLKDMLSAKKQKNPQFSLRAWARLLGMKTHTPLQLMLASKRPIPKKYIPLFGKSLSLSEEEVGFLEVMIDHQRARNPIEKNLQLNKMNAIKREKLGAAGFPNKPATAKEEASNEDAAKEEMAALYIKSQKSNSSYNLYR